MRWITAPRTSDSLATPNGPLGVYESIENKIIRSPSTTNLAMQGVYRVCDFCFGAGPSRFTKPKWPWLARILFDVRTNVVLERHSLLLDRGGVFAAVVLPSTGFHSQVGSLCSPLCGDSLSHDFVLGKPVGEACMIVLLVYSSDLFSWIAHHREIYRLPAFTGVRQILARGSCPSISRVSVWD